ncbi:MAG: tetratricopeptide repeat protein, partial [Kiritimatiellaeota bacterium]|nr:tetratricopeptide repeat protein [Kiritimatiellota bacterium]
GDRMWIPSEESSSQAFREYVEDVHMGRRPNNGGVTFKDGSIQVTGVLAVMEINGILVKQIFDHNKDQHDFYVEEIYPIAWMHPYLRPCGNILKLEKEPLPSPKEDPRLWNEILARDTTHWGALEKTLLAHEGYADNQAAQKSFAKLRTAIGGVYLSRGMREEAEAAFKQAVRLGPNVAAEGSFRLAEPYRQTRRYDEARKILRDYQALDGQNEHIRLLLKQIDEKEIADSTGAPQ